MKKLAWIFPGQGVQYPGMGKDFFLAFPVAKRTFEEADDFLGLKLSEIAFFDRDKLLSKTLYSQLAIYVVSVAIMRTMKELFPQLVPFVCAGLSLGEYSALCASNRLAYSEGLSLVRQRAQFMEEACEKNPGAMAAVLGLQGEEVERAIDSLPSPRHVWTANFNCPGQVVITGTKQGVEAAVKEIHQLGGKSVVLPVQGAFHSPLMEEARNRLVPLLLQVPLEESSIQMVMNVVGDFVASLDEVRRLLIQQVTESVRWEQGIRSMEREGVEAYLEIGSGRSLSSMNRRIGVKGLTLNLEKVEDIKTFEKQLPLLLG